MAQACLAGLTARPAAGIPLHASPTDDTTFAEQANRVLARKLIVERLRMGYLPQSTRCGSLCRLSKERAEDGQAGRFRRNAW